MREKCVRNASEMRAKRAQNDVEVAAPQIAILRVSVEYRSWPSGAVGPTPMPLAALNDANVVGVAVGVVDGAPDGAPVKVGLVVGVGVGLEVGLAVGFMVGSEVVGAAVGLADGFAVGLAVGLAVGETVAWQTLFNQVIRVW